MDEHVLTLLETGYGLQRSGQLDQAEARYREALRQDPENFHALNLLGVICINTDRAAEAADLITAAVEQDPGDAEALANLGLAQKDLKQFTEAGASLQRAIRLNPHNPVTHNNLGNVQAALGDFKAAVEAYRTALRLDPDYAECLSNLAAALKEVRQYDGALAAADRAIELRPDFAEAHNNRGEILFKQARFAEAAESYRAAVDHRQNYVAAMINLSSARKECGDVDAAREILDDVLRRNPDSPRAHNSLGVLLEQLGHGDDAAKRFREAIRLSPDYANAYYQLAQLRGQGLSDEEMEAVERLIGRSETLDNQRMPLAFALACAYENCGDHDRSFFYLDMAKALKSKRSAYDDAQVSQYYDSISKAFDADFPKSEGVVGGPLQASCTRRGARDGQERRAPIRARQGRRARLSLQGPSDHTLAAADHRHRPEGPRPVFILGMPRSGTSLTEQILSSHPDVHGAGELSFMEDTISEASHRTGKPFPELSSSLTPALLDDLGALYLGRLTARSGNEAVVVDKTPMNFQYIGFIARILPDARFIHCRRNPVDNCLSIFKLPFEESHSYAHGLESLGKYYKRYAGLMAHWNRIVPDRIATVAYEDLVADFEAETRRLLEFLDLPFSASVLAFHKTKRIVKTPSASQIRQPIYSTSVDRWKKYRKHLGPLLTQLETLQDG